MSVNPTHGSSSDEDLLARAVGALRRTPMADGPSAETLVHTLAALQAAAGSPTTILYSRRKVMFAIFKMAAAVLVAAAGLFYVSGPYLAGAPVAFEEVAQKLQNAHTFAYVMMMEFGKEATPIATRLLFKEPGLHRSETLPSGGLVLIFDKVAGKMLTLDPASKSAVLLEGRLPGAAREDQAANAAADLRNLAQKKGEAIGEKPIGKVQTQGFRVKEETGHELLIWVDPRTRRPVQVEITGKVGDQPFHGILSDFELDSKLDDALFSLQPPEGYSFRKVALNADPKDDGTPESAVAMLLHGFAEKSAGVFPKRLDDWAAYDKLYPKGTFKSPADPALIRMVSTVVRVQIFLLEQKGAYGYKADGVKLGDADKIIFWYQPKGKETYRAVFGDLHVADVALDRLPAVEKAQPKP